VISDFIDQCWEASGIEGLEPDCESEGFREDMRLLLERYLPDYRGYVEADPDLPEEDKQVALKSIDQMMRILEKYLR